MIFMLAGEASGDLHGSRLAKALNPEQIFGVAGPKMRAAGVECLIPMEEFQLMGFSDVIKALPRLKRQLKQICNAIFDRKPEAVIMIDYPGFNMKLAKELRKRGYKGKLIQYICPKVWAWRPGRIDQLAKTLDLLLVIFPFEVELFKNTSLRVEYVGNPLTELHAEYKEDPNWKSRMGFDQEILALFPGSRKSEIQLNLPRMLETAKKLNKQVGLSVANENIRPLILKLTQNHNVKLIEPNESYHLMRNAKAALATSGTVTLELALQGVPTVVVYRLTPFNAFLAGVVFRINLTHYALANIVAQKTLFPELMHYHFTVKNAKKYLQSYLGDTPARHTCIQECQRLHTILKRDHPSQIAADIIKKMILITLN